MYFFQCRYDQERQFLLLGKGQVNLFENLPRAMFFGEISDGVDVLFAHNSGE